jgi:hypothetical protein
LCFGGRVQSQWRDDFEGVSIYSKLGLAPFSNYKVKGKN